VKSLEKIAIILLGTLFLLSSTGIVIYQSFCACTGYQHVSLYVAPETCESNYHHQHTCNSDENKGSSAKDNCHECQDHTDKCGCNSPKINYLKIDDRYVNAQIRLETYIPFEIITPVDTPVFYPDAGKKDSFLNYSDPPPLSPTALDFLIHIHQLKLHCIA
jgi:hypothetical protein